MFSEPVPDSDKSGMGNGSAKVSFDGGVDVRQVGEEEFRPVDSRIDSEGVLVNVFPDHVTSEGRRMPAVHSSAGENS